MVYLLHAYFGRDGRQEAEALLLAGRATPTIRASSAPSTRRRRIGCRTSCSRISPIATANISSRASPNRVSIRWRTCRFMLTEEAHHLFVGESGIGRMVARTCQLMKEHDTDSVSEYGGIDLDIIQKYINFHYSVSLDFFGSELSTNAANYFSAG